MARTHLSHVVASDDDHVRLWTVTKADVQYLCKAWLLTSAQYDELRTSNSLSRPGFLDRADRERVVPDLDAITTFFASAPELEQHARDFAKKIDADFE